MDISFDERVRYLLQDPAWKNYNIAKRLRRIVEDISKGESKK